MSEKPTPEMLAMAAVYSALHPLELRAQLRVLRSVVALLDLKGIFAGESKNESAPPSEKLGSGAGSAASSQSARPVSIVELIKEKQPGGMAQRIALFAYYREKHEGLARFARGDLEGYFSKAKQPPSANYDRDFVEAVKKGWLHEDGNDSYITTRGIEAVESGFAGERKRNLNGPRGSSAKPGFKARTSKK